MMMRLHCRRRCHFRRRRNVIFIPCVNPKGEQKNGMKLNRFRNDTHSHTYTNLRVVQTHSP